MGGGMQTVDTANAEHYAWGDGCDGWHLLKRDDVSIIQESVPPGKAEVNHFHKISRQFFYVLEGEATIVTGSRKIVLKKHQGLEIPPGVSHQFRNDSPTVVSFLVISVPKSHGDRYDVGAEVA